MGGPRRPRRSRALRVGTFALLAVVGGCGRERRISSPAGLYKYGVPTAPDPTPVAVGWTSTAIVSSEPVAPTPPPAGEAPAPASAPQSASTSRAEPPRAAAPAAESRGPYKVAAVEGGGTVRGVCRLAGDPARPPLEIFKDNDKGCGAKQQPTERLVVGAGQALANCFVSVRGVKAGKDFPAEMRGEDRAFTLDQKGCRYRPHVGFLRVLTQVVVKNSDGADHNIHGYLGSFASTKFNFSSAPGSTIPDAQSAFLEDAGEYLVKCDIHPWMSAVLHVVTDPYHDVTGAQDAPGRKAGEFVIEDVPPGEYDVVCWHEGMEEHPVMADGKIASYSYSPDVWGVASPQGKVKVAAGQTATVDFEFQAPPKK